MAEKIIPLRRYDAEWEKENNIIGQHLAEVRKQAGLNRAALSRKLRDYGIDISTSAVLKWENRDTVINAYQLLAVCRALDVEDVYSFCSDNSPQLNAEGMAKLREYKLDLIASGRYAPESTSGEIEYIEMPLSCLTASAGTGAFLDEGNYEMVSFPADSVPVNADFALRVSGDSMEPVFSDGQIVWVQKCQRVRVGEVGIFVYDGEGYIKVYGEREPEDAEAFTDSEGVIHMQPVMISYNKSYDPRPISPEAGFAVVGRVIK